MNQITDKPVGVAVHKSIGAALAAAQSQMGPALKDSTNPAFKSKYADLASVMAACMPALSAHGIAVIQPPCSDADGNRSVKTVLIHGETGETLECAVPLIVSKNDMQGYGSAVTYARRYGLMAMAGIAPDDDDGNAAAAAAPRQEPRQEQRPAGPTEAALSDARAQLDAAASLQDLQQRWLNLPTAIKADIGVTAAKDARKAALTAPAADLGGDEIPY